MTFLHPLLLVAKKWKSLTQPFRRVSGPPSQAENIVRVVRVLVCGRSGHLVYIMHHCVWHMKDETVIVLWRGFKKKKLLSLTRSLRRQDPNETDFG